MKKRLLFLCILLGVAVLVQSQNRLERAYLNNEVRKVSKYKGFIDVGGGFGVGKYGKGLGLFSFQTSHGYQFNPYFYLGVGVGVDRYIGEGLDPFSAGFLDKFFFPIFADARVNFLDKSITPFFDAKIGYSIHEYASSSFIPNLNPYFNPNLGVSFKLKKKTALNLGIGYIMQMDKQDYYNYYNYDYNYDYDYRHKNIIKGSITVRLGVEF